jgi:hypothetical protein
MLLRHPALATRARSSLPSLLKSASANVWPKRKTGLIVTLADANCEALNGRAANTSSANSSPIIGERLRFTAVDYNSPACRNAIILS